MVHDVKDTPKVSGQLQNNSLCHFTATQ